MYRQIDTVDALVFPGLCETFQILHRAIGAEGMLRLLLWRGGGMHRPSTSPLDIETGVCGHCVGNGRNN